METKKCTNCQEEKALEDFCKNKKCKNGRGSWCRKCHSELCSYARRKDYFVKFQRKLRQTDKNRKYEKEYRSKYSLTLSGVVSKMLCGARHRAKINKLSIDIDRQWIMEHLSSMACEATGVGLVLETDSSVQHTPFKPSIDRINNTKGYTKDNCRIVAVIYNKAKSDYLDEDVMRMAMALVQKNALQSRILG